MSILKKAMAITRFKVSGIPEVDGVDVVENMLNKFESGKVKEMEMGDEMVWGWTKLLDPYCPEFSDLSFMTGDYVTVGFRIDKKTVQGAVLKRELYLAEKAELTRLQVPKLARAQKTMIKEAVVKNLLAKAPVVPAMFDIVWNVQDHMLYLFSTNKLAREIVEDMMLESFGLSIQMVFPFTMGLKDVDESVLSTIAPESFV